MQERVGVPVGSNSDTLQSLAVGFGCCCDANLIGDARDDVCRAVVPRLLGGGSRVAVVGMS